MPQALMLILGAVGAAIVAKFIAKEWRRVNDELDRAKAETAPVENRRDAMPSLRPDPVTGEYRPHR